MSTTSATLHKSHLNYIFHIDGLCLCIKLGFGLPDIIRIEYQLGNFVYLKFIHIKLSTVYACLCYYYIISLTIDTIIYKPP